MRRYSILLIGIAVASVTLLAQTPANPSAQTPSASTAFDVVSIKRNITGGRETMVAHPGGRLTATNLTLRSLIRATYQLQDDQIHGGPEWISTERFDVEAKPEADTPLAQLGPMLRALLVERFKLAVHSEQRELPIFALVSLRGNSQRAPGLRDTACPV